MIAACIFIYANKINYILNFINYPNIFLEIIMCMENWKSKCLNKDNLYTLF